MQRPRRRPCMTLASALLIASMVAGCMSPANLRPTRHDTVLGIPRYYHHAKAEIFQAAQDVTREHGMRIVETAPDQSYFIAQRGITGLDWGLLVGVYVTHTIDQATLVLIRVEPRFAANLALREVATVFHDGIRSKLTAP